MSTMKDNERLELLKEIGGTKVYEERRTESLKILHETANRRQRIMEVVCFPHTSGVEQSIFCNSHWPRVLNEQVLSLGYMTCSGLLGSLKGCPYHPCCYGPDPRVIHCSSYLHSQGGADKAHNLVLAAVDRCSSWRKG